MKDILIVGILGLVGFYGYAVSVAKKIAISVAGVSIEKLNKTAITLGIWLDTTNPSGSLILQDIDLDIYLNSQYAGKLKLPYQQFITEGDGTILATVALQYDTLGDEIWNAFLKMLSYDCTLTITGKIKVNHLFVPVPQISVYKFNVAELVKGAFTEGE